MAANYGPTPWSDTFSSWRRSTKKQRASGWNFTNGWLPYDVSQETRKIKQKKMRSLTSSSGQTYYLPENDYDNFIGFTKDTDGTELSEEYTKARKYKEIKTPADYIDYAFNISKATIIEIGGCGHIKTLWYAKTYQLLKVEFTNNGAVVVFFRLPVEVAGQLFAFAQSKQTRVNALGEERHLLGITFWDLVRIRGTMHGSRYKFQYIQEGSTSGNPVGRPYGSGRNIYIKNDINADTKKTLNEYNKDLYAQVKNKEEYIKSASKDEDSYNKKLMQDDIDHYYKSHNDEYNNMLKQLYNTRPELLRNTDRKVDIQKAVNKLPQRLVDELNEKGGNINVQDAIYRYNLTNDKINALNDIVTHHFNRDEYIKSYNDKKMSKRTWNRDTLKEAISNLDSNKASVVNRITSPAKQFSYLQSIGVIPENAIYKKE